MHPLRWAAALCALAISSAAEARPYTVDDVLHLESLGASAIDPSGRWLMQEVEGPYDQAASFFNGANTRPAHAHLVRADLEHPGPGVAAFPQNRAGGYIAGPFSPSGRYMAVYHDQGETWRLGILEVASGKVRWLGFGVEFADFGDTLAWRSDTELVALAMPPGDRYYKERLANDAMTKTPELWARASSGRGRTDFTVGSGRFIDTHLPDPKRRLVVIDARSGSTRTLSEGEFERLSLASDGRSLAVVESYGRILLDGAQLISQATPFKRARLHLFDLATGRHSSPCPDLEPLANSLRWAPAGDRLLALLRPSLAEWTSGRITLVTGQNCAPLDLGTLHPVAGLEGSAGAPETHFDWLGATPIVLAMSRAERSDWFAIRDDGAATNLTRDLKTSPGDPVVLLSDRAIFQVGKHPWTVTLDGQATALEAPALDLIRPKRSNMSLPVAQDGASRATEVFATAAESGSLTLWRLAAAGAEPILRAPGERQTVVAASAKALITRTSNDKGSEAIEIWGREGRHATVVAINQNLASVDFAAPREIDHFGPNGEALKSWLYLPPATRGGKPPPLLVMAYPSAAYSSPPYTGRPGVVVGVPNNAQLGVAHGYAVLVPSLPPIAGATEPGKGWDTAIFRIVDKVAETGLVDTEQLAYWGHSFGGYVGLMLATQTGRFKAIIASAPMSNLMSFRGEGWPAAWLNPEAMQAAEGWAGWSELGPQGHTLTTPWLNRELYVENSPVFMADRIHTPIMLVQGDQDAAPVGQSREMFSDLYRLNKDALLVTLYGEGHAIASPPNYRAYAEAGYRFLDLYLKADAPPGVPAASASSVSSVGPNLQLPRPAGASQNLRAAPNALR